MLVGDNEQEVFLGRELQQPARGVGEDGAAGGRRSVARDHEAFDRARSVLTENMDLLHAMAASLLERETLTRDDIGS